MADEKIDSRQDDGKEGRSGLEKFLSIFADVRRGEGVTALLLTFGLFLLLTAYYMIKPIRDSLITGVEGGTEKKAYMGAVIAVSLLLAVPAYASFASRVPRNKLLLWVNVFFVSNLVAFYLLSVIIPGQGNGALFFALGFFLWVGIFNMMVIAQYWAFANDVYTEAQGKRLFPLIGIGASVGSAFGSMALEQGIKALKKSAEKSGGSGAQAIAPLLLAAGVILAASAAIALLVHRRESHGDAKEPKKDASKAPAKKDGAFKLVFSNRYLLLLAFFSLVFTLVNTNSEYVKDVLVKLQAYNDGGATEERVKKAVCNKVDGECTVEMTSEPKEGSASAVVYTAKRVTDKGEQSFKITTNPVKGDDKVLSDDEAKRLKDEFKKSFKKDGAFVIVVESEDKKAAQEVHEGLMKNVDEARTLLFNDFYLWVNILGALLQSFVVSRIVKLLGLKGAFFILPVIALLDATTIALLPVWGFKFADMWRVVRYPKIAENATDYSLNNTLRNMLWLPTTKEMKYLAKQAVDTFFVRMGDVGSALCVFVLADTLKLGVTTFAIANIGFLAIWFVLARLIVAENVKMAHESQARAAKEGQPA